MAITRTAILDALVSLITEVGADYFKQVSHDVKHWDDVPASEQPAAFVTLADQTPYYGTAGAPPIWTLTFAVYVYARRTPADEAFPYRLPEVLDALERCLEAKREDRGTGFIGGPGVSAQTTLGGLAVYARITGTTETDEGLLGDQQVAVVRIEVKTKAGG